MIQLEEASRENVIIAVASGKVTADDYEKVLMPELDAADSKENKVRFLYVLGPAFDGYETEAAMDDAKVGMHHWGDFDRIGLVTDHDVYRVMTKAFGFLMPGKVKVFPLSEETAARDWIVAD